MAPDAVAAKEAPLVEGRAALREQPVRLQPQAVSLAVVERAAVAAIRRVHSVVAADARRADVSPSEQSGKSSRSSRHRSLVE